VCVCVCVCEIQPSPKCLIHSLLDRKSTYKHGGQVGVAQTPETFKTHTHTHTHTHTRLPLSSSCFPSACFSDDVDVFPHTVVKLVNRVVTVTGGSVTDVNSLDGPESQSHLSRFSMICPGSP